MEEETQSEFSYVEDLAPMITDSAFRTDCFNETFSALDLMKWVRLNN